jgi:hypothetical protein
MTLANQSRLFHLVRTNSMNRPLLSTTELGKDDFYASLPVIFVCASKQPIAFRIRCL